MMPDEPNPIPPVPPAAAVESAPPSEPAGGSVPETAAGPSLPNAGPHPADDAAVPPALIPERAGLAPGDRPLALLEIILVSGILTDILAVALAGWLTGFGRSGVHERPFGLFVFLMISTVFILGSVALCQHLRRDRPEVRLRIRPRSGWGWELGAVLFCIPVVFVTMSAVQMLLLLLDPQWVQQGNPVLAMIRTPADLSLFLVSGVIAGGVREEIQRAFIIRRCAVFFWSPWLGLLLWSGVFGLAHAPQGPAAIVTTALLGLEFGIFYLWRGSLPVPVAVHALFNVAVLVIYWTTR